MIEIGKMNNLTVVRETESGYYLIDEDSYQEVFLPPALANQKVEKGDKLDVFVYVDTKDKLIATCKVPFAQVGEFASLEVVDVQEFGAFLDLGVEKDLLIPANEQKIKIRSGDRPVVRICLEEGADRVFGTTKFGKYLEKMEFDIQEGDEVSVVPVDVSDLGYRVIINKKYIGLLYQNEVFTAIKFDQPYTAFVKKIRVDGFVDVSLQKQGIKNLDDSKKKILDHLFKFGGISPLHDKSSPEEIREKLGMSKKTFKNSLGMLYKDRMVLLKKDRTELARRKKKS